MKSTLNRVNIQGIDNSTFRACYFIVVLAVSTHMKMLVAFFIRRRCTARLIILFR